VVVVRFWHLADMTAAIGDVRFWRVKRTTCARDQFFPFWPEADITDCRSSTVCRLLLRYAMARREPHLPRWRTLTIAELAAFASALF